MGETPKSAMETALTNASRALETIDSVGADERITKNRDEFRRLRNDTLCIYAMAKFYDSKTRAAELVLRFAYSHKIEDMRFAGVQISDSVADIATLSYFTKELYHFANSMQTSHRKIPFPGAVNGVGTNYHWTQVLPLYQKEFEDFQKQVAESKNPKRAGAQTNASITPWPAAKFKLISTNAETYEVKVGARPFADRQCTITELAPELNGLTGIRFSHEAAKNGRYVPVEFEVTEPVQVLIGYFNNPRAIWLQVPNLDVASHADERGGVDALLRNAAAIEQCPNVNVHAFRYEPGRHKLELIGKGSFVVLGVVPQSLKLEKRDAKVGAK